METLVRAPDRPASTAGRLDGHPLVPHPTGAPAVGYLVVAASKSGAERVLCRVPAFGCTAGYGTALTLARQWRDADHGRWATVMVERQDGTVGY